MDEIVLKAVERAIDTMRVNLGERLTIDDVARAAMFSKFHFTRIFQRATGVSPGRFLSALRLEEAKHLLLTTSVTVADIGHRVGYNSVGTFSSRFSSSVGVSPITYRQLGGVATRIPRHDRHDETGMLLRGHVRGPVADELGPIFVGLFPSRVPEGAPVRHAVLPGMGGYQLHDVPSGTWHLMAHAVGSVPSAPGGPARRYVGCYGPFTTETDARLVDVVLRPVQNLDPPLLLALPELREPAQLDLAG